MLNKTKEIIEYINSEYVPWKINHKEMKTYVEIEFENSTLTDELINEFKQFGEIIEWRGWAETYGTIWITIRFKKDKSWNNKNKV